MATIARRIADGLMSMMSGLGSGADRAKSLRYRTTLISPADVTSAYRESWIVRKIHDLPPVDMTREWRIWNADNDAIEKIEAEEKRLAIRHKVKQALLLARLYGGAALLLGVDDGTAQNEPLDPESVKEGGLKFVNVLSRWQITLGQLDMDAISETFGQPVNFTVGSSALEVHPSRVVSFVGQPLPHAGLTSSLDSYWGDPLLQSIRDAVEATDISLLAASSLVQVARTRTLKVPDLMSLVSSQDFEKKFIDRVAAMSMGESLVNMGIIDADETIETAEVSFSGLPDVLRVLLQIGSGAADIPATRLIGQAPQGMNATGDSDMRNYYDMLAGKQSNEMTPAMALLDEVLVRSAIGSTNPDITYDWAPLWQMTPEVQAARLYVITQAMEKIIASGAIPDSAIATTYQNTLIEEGSLVGLEAALAEAKAAGEIPPIEEADPVPTVDPVTGLPIAPQPGAQPRQAPPAPGRRPSSLPAPPPASARRAANDGADEARIRDAIEAGVAAALQRAAPPRRHVADDTMRTLYVSRPLLNATEFRAWAKGQGFETAVPAGELHVTIVYSKSPVDWMQLPSDWAGDKDGKLTIPPGGARLVDRLGAKGAVVLMFASSSLQWRHEDLIAAGCTSDYEGYTPHVTITYKVPDDFDVSAVEPFQGELIFGPEVWAEVSDGWGGDLIEDARAAAE